MASRVCLPQDSTDSMLDVPVMEAIQRRHSEVKLGSSQQLSTCNSSGLAPPRSPELRRHSDVSPASIRELEKVCIKILYSILCLSIHCHSYISVIFKNWLEMRYFYHFDWIHRHIQKFKDNSGWNKPGTTNPSRPASPSMRIDFNAPLSRAGSRRQSRVVARQHSYDDDIKASTVESINNKDTGLELPNIPRRYNGYKNIYHMRGFIYLWMSRIKMKDLCSIFINFILQNRWWRICENIHIIWIFANVYNRKSSRVIFR